MADDNILKLGMSQEELEDTIQFSQQMVQELLEMIGEAMGDAEQLRRENRALRSALEAAGLPLPQLPAPAAYAAEIEAAPATHLEAGEPEVAPLAAPEDSAASVLDTAGGPPVEAPPPAPAQQPVPAASGAERDPRLGDGVLIVDDSKILQMRLRSLIEPLGVPIVGYAANGAEGVKSALALNPRVVIMDFNMPVLNGLEAAKVLQRDAPQIRIIICAADLTASVSRELIQSGVTEILTKPIQLDHFVRSIKRCMDERRLDKAQK